MNPAVTTSQYVAAARSYLGVPFRHQGRSRETGVDCIGLAECSARDVEIMREEEFSRAYGRVPRSSLLEQGLGSRCVEIAVADARDGDIYLLTFKGQPQHVAIAATDADGATRTMIHALRTESGVNRVVVEETLQRWGSSIVAAYRIPELIYDGEGVQG